MTGSKTFIHRREVLTFGMAATLTVMLPIRASTQTSENVIVTKTEFSADTPEATLKGILDRRIIGGQVSRKVLRSSSNVLIIEEWKGSMQKSDQRFVRREI